MKRKFKRNYQAISCSWKRNFPVTPYLWVGRLVGLSVIISKIKKDLHVYILSDLDVPKEHQNPFLRPLKPNKNPKIGNLFPPKKKNKKTDPLLTKKLTPHRGGRGRVWGLKTPTSSPSTTTTTASTARTTTTTTPTRPPSVKNPQLSGRENAQNAVAFQEEDQEQRSGQLRVVDNPRDPIGKIFELFFIKA